MFQLSAEQKCCVKGIYKRSEACSSLQKRHGTHSGTSGRGARRAAGFLKLHEAAIAKEFQEVEPDEVQSSTSPKKRATRQAKGKQRSDTSQQSHWFRERAQEELQSLIADGPNAKWAVGPTLDLDDIRALLQCGPAVPVANIPGTTWITLQVVIQDWILTQRLHPAQQDHWSIQTGPTMSRPSLISPLMPFRNLCCSKPLRDQRRDPIQT